MAITVFSPGCSVGLRGSPGQSMNCSAGEKARVRISSVTTSPVMPDAAKIMATTMNW